MMTFLITKRVLTKTWAPGWWEVSGGAAQAGESSYDAVLREVKEETGLDVSSAQGGYLFTYKRENPGEGDNYFVDVYRFVMDVKEEDLHLQEEETDGHMFATLNQIKEFAAQENSCTMTVFRLPLRICRFIIYSAGNNCDMQGDFFNEF